MPMGGVLIDKFISLSKIINPNSLNEPLLHIAIRLNKIEAVAAILEAKLGDINEPHPTNGYTPLHFAIHYGNFNIVTLLIERKADLTRLNLENLSPLDFGRKKGYVIEDLELATRQVSASESLAESVKELGLVPEPKLVTKPGPQSNISLNLEIQPPQSLFKNKDYNDEVAIRNQVILECCKEIDRLEPESTRNHFSMLFFISYDYSDTKINAYKTIIQTIKSTSEMSIKNILNKNNLKKLLVRKDGDLIDGMGVINRDKKTKEFYNVYDALTSRRFFFKSKSENKLAELQDLVSSQLGSKN